MPARASSPVRSLRLCGRSANAGSNRRDPLVVCIGQNAVGRVFRSRSMVLMRASVFVCHIATGLLLAKIAASTKYFRRIADLVTQSPVGAKYISIGAGVRITMRENESGSSGPLPLPPAGAGPNFADATNRRWFVGSSPMFRDPCGVCYGFERRDIGPASPDESRSGCRPRWRRTHSPTQHRSRRRPLRYRSATVATTLPA